MHIKLKANKCITIHHSTFESLSMPIEYTTYQLKALLQLANFHNKFYNTHTNEPITGKGKDETIALKKSMDAFIEVFCQHHFADSDYTVLQKESRSKRAMEEWLNEVSIEGILKLTTYIIWTDKTIHGYFIKRINDRTMQKLLIRLEFIVLAMHRQQKMLAESQEKKVNTPVADTMQQIRAVG